MNKKYFDICNKTVYEIMGEANSGDVDKANYALSKLLTSDTNMKMFLMSTGKWSEYIGWLSRFKKKYPGIEKYISQNLELEED